MAEAITLLYYYTIYVCTRSKYNKYIRFYDIVAIYIVYVP